MQSYHIQDANPTGGKAGKGRNKTSTVQVFDDTDTWNAFLVKMFRFNVGDPQSHQKAKNKASEWVKEQLAQREKDVCHVCKKEYLYPGQNSCRFCGTHR